MLMPAPQSRPVGLRWHGDMALAARWWFLLPATWKSTN